MVIKTETSASACHSGVDAADVSRASLAEVKVLLQTALPVQCLSFWATS